MIAATRELLAPRPQVWALVAEPYHLPDWWPGYTGVRPDRRGLAHGARWTVMRSQAPGLLRRPGGEGLIVLEEIAQGIELRWHDVQQGYDAGVRLANAEDQGRTLATAYVDGPWWRLVLEGARPLPERALTRLHDLCQTTAAI